MEIEWFEVENPYTGETVRVPEVPQSEWYKTSYTLDMIAPLNCFYEGVNS